MKRFITLFALVSISIMAFGQGVFNDTDRIFFKVGDYTFVRSDKIMFAQRGEKHRLVHYGPIEYECECLNDEAIKIVEHVKRNADYYKEEYGLNEIIIATGAVNLPFVEPYKATVSFVVKYTDWEEEHSKRQQTKVDNSKEKRLESINW